MQSRVVLITGASSGIGAACARRLAETSRVALVARRSERLHQLVASIEAAGGEAVALPADLSEPGAPSSVVRRCLTAFGGISALVNNAGVFRTASAADSDAGFIAEQLTLNLQAPMLLTRAALPAVIDHGGGWIVNISSVAADAGFPHCGVYGATKAGLEAYSRSLREELREHGVRVGVVVPGATDTEVWPADCPFDRQKMCRAEDVARAVQFMLDAPPSASIDQIRVTPPGGAL